MKRDWNVIRKILIHIEDGRTQDLDSEDGQIYKHCCLLKDAGYIGFIRISGGMRSRSKYEDGWLTWKGHDLLEYIGNGTVIEELEEYGHPITEYTLKKYAEFMLEKELFEEGEEVVD